MKKILFFLLILSFAITLPTGVFAAEEEGAETDQISVAGVKVTIENAADILGDGSAIYTGQTDTLTIRRYDADGFHTINGILYSVYCSGKTKIIIEGENHFPQGVYTAGGDIVLNRADVTFGNSAFFTLYAPYGSLKVTGSKVTLGDLTYVPSNNYSVMSKTIVFEKSELTLSTTAPSMNLSAAVIYATENLSATDSDFSISLPYPISGAMFMGGNLSFTDCDISIARGNYAFHTPNGYIAFEGCEVSVEQTRSFSSSLDFIASDTDIEATVFYQGIHAVGGENGDGFVAVSSNLVLKMLSFAECEEVVLKKTWENMSNKEKEPYLQSYDRFVDSFRSTTYKEATEGNAGIAVSSSGCYLQNAKMNIKGFDVGMLGLYGIPIQMDTRCDLVLDAKVAALLWFALSSDYVLIDDYRASGSQLTFTEVPENLQRAGLYALCSTEGQLTFLPGITWTETEESDESKLKMGDLLAHIQGASPYLRLETPPYSSTIVALTVVGIVFAAAFVGAAVLIFMPNFRMMGKKSVVKAEKGNGRSNKK